MSDFNLDASAALAEIRNLVKEVNNLKGSLKNISTSNVEDFAKMENAFSNITAKIGLLSNKLNYLEAIMKKNSITINSNTQAINSNSSATTNNTKAATNNANAANSNTTATNKGTIANNNKAKSTTSLTNKLYDLVKVYILLKAAGYLKDLVVEVYDLAKTFDSLDFAMQKITGNLENAADSQRFLIEITSAFGVELVSTTNRWIKFLAAAKQSGLSLKATEDIFRSMTKAAGVLGLKTDELQGIYLALEQMLSKGKVTTEELRRQLGERLPGAMGIMAAAIGVTLPKLDEMLKKGEVLSAEVLPKFAKAVELAYDIENVNRIETLIASQNRLTASWQLFIKNISEGDGVIRKTFGFFLTVVNQAIDKLDQFYATRNQEIQRGTVVATDVLKSELDELAENELSLDGYKFKREIAAAKIKLEKATSKELIDIAEAEYAAVLQKLKVHNEEKEAIIKKYAKENIVSAREEYEKSLEELEKFTALEKKLENDKEDAGMFATVFTPDYGVAEAFGDEKFDGKIIKTRKNFEEASETIVAKVEKATAKWFLFKKLIEESEVVVPGGDEEDEPKSISQVRLRDIADLTLEIQNEILRNNVSMNKAILEDDKSSIAQRRDAIYNLHENMVSIAENSNAIVLRDLDAFYKKEREIALEAVNEGRLSRSKYNTFIVESEVEKNQKIKIASERLQNDLTNIQNSTISNSLKIDKDDESIDVDEVQDLYNKRIALAKKEYEASSKLTEDKIKLEKELKNISIEAANAIIDAKIKILKASIEGKNADDEWVQSVQRGINELEASRSIIPGPEEEDIAKWKNFWDTILGFAADFNNAIGDLVDSVFQNRIENIEAEIDAETKKYDSLIELAEGDDQQQKNLEEEKEARIKELEAKRLKESQKQAKAKKAFAISDILISTARAIMGIWADVPKVDFGISAGLMTAFVSTLGAAQIASVLASPIPKYKEGGEIDREHVGMINDGLFKEYIERNGEILTTDRKNAIVNLKPGDTIYKSYEDMNRKSRVMKTMTNNTRISQDKFDKLFFGVEDSIIKGFSKAKINNRIINKVYSNNDDYRRSLSKWN